MQGIALLRVLTVDGHPTAVGFDLPEAYLASLLDQQGVRYVLMDPVAPDRPGDVAREILRLRADAVVMGTDAGATDAAGRLATAIRTQRADLPVLAWSVGPAGLEVTGNEMPDAGLPAMIRKILEVLARGLDDLPSPYEDGVLAPADAPRLGLLAFWAGRHVNARRLVETLTWLGNRLQQTGGPVPLRAPDLLEDHAWADELMSGLAGTMSPPLLGRCRGSTLDAGWVKRLREAGFVRVAVAGEIPGAAAEAARDLGMRLEPATSPGWSRLVSLFTGLYSAADGRPGTRHLLLGGARSREGQSEEAETAAAGGLVDGLTLDVTVRTGRTDGDIHRLPYRLRTDGLIRGRLNVLCLEAREDLEDLAGDLEAFHARGQIKLPHPEYSAVLENGCRWSGKAACSVPWLRRLELREDGTAMACLDAGTVGLSGDRWEAMLHTARERFVQEEARRGCARCPVRDRCSHCPHLPPHLEPLYCDMRRRFPLTALFVQIQAFPVVASRHLKGVSAPWFDARLSLPWCWHHLDGAGAVRDRQGTEAQPGSVLLIEAGVGIFVWQLPHRLLRLNKPMAAILEGSLGGLEQADLALAFGERFACSEQVARRTVEEGLTWLRRLGLVQHGVVPA